MHGAGRVTRWRRGGGEAETWRMVMWMTKEQRREEGRRAEGCVGAVAGWWGVVWVCSIAPLELGCPARNLVSLEFQPLLLR